MSDKKNEKALKLLKKHSTSDDIVAIQPMFDAYESLKDFFVWIKGEDIFIKKSQVSDWIKLLFLYPKPVWSEDVTSNKAVEELSDLGLCVENSDGWHLTEKAIALIKTDHIRVE